MAGTLRHACERGGATGVRAGLRGAVVLLYFLVRRIRLFNRGAFARCTDTIPRYGNLGITGVMTGTFERDGLRLGGLWWNYRLHYVGVASMQELIQG